MDGWYICRWNLNPYDPAIGPITDTRAMDLATDIRATDLTTVTRVIDLVTGIVAIVMSIVIATAMAIALITATARGQVPVTHQPELAVAAPETHAAIPNAASALFYCRLQPSSPINGLSRRNFTGPSDRKLGLRIWWVLKSQFPCQKQCWKTFIQAPSFM